MHRGPVYQDWEPVVFKKAPKETKKNFNPENTKKNNELNGDEIVAPEYVTHEQAQFLIEARNAKGWKQTDLAKACNMNVSVIRDIETAKAIYNKRLYNNLLKALNVKINTKKEQS
jgi:ribosome-binding protein aMBF1 (putative translation factor)